LITNLRGRYTVLVVTHPAQAKRIADEVALFWVMMGWAIDRVRFIAQILNPHSTP